MLLLICQLNSCFFRAALINQLRSHYFHFSLTGVLYLSPSGEPKLLVIKYLQLSFSVPLVIYFSLFLKRETLTLKHLRVLSLASVTRLICILVVLRLLTWHTLHTLEFFFNLTLFWLRKNLLCSLQLSFILICYLASISHKEQVIINYRYRILCIPKSKSGPALLLRFFYFFVFGFWSRSTENKHLKNVQLWWVFSFFWHLGYQKILQTITINNMIAWLINDKKKALLHNWKHGREINFLQEDFARRIRFL